MGRFIYISALVLVSGCGCGDDAPPAVDAGVDAMGTDVATDAPGPTDAGADTPDSGTDTSTAVCGNNVVEAGEQCDDGNRAGGDGCNSDCQNSCGDGMVEDGELCDIGIAGGGAGACPSDCNDDNACTTDTIGGADCQAVCTYGDVTACASDDGCCPSGCTATEDNDCDAVCGNAVVEMGETCEPTGGIPCIGTCDDGNVCTTDSLTGGPATCDSACTFDPITACVNGDGCCAMGCTAAMDDDCSDSCGNGVLEPPELCEDGSATPCPTSCDDAMACTTDTLVGSAASCNAECSNVAITSCIMTADGCCPGACNATNDGDCSPVCGNRVVEMGEECDDGNMVATDACDMCMSTVTPTAFRFTDMDLRDPHVFTSIGICFDVTSTLNNQLQTNLTSDANGDGTLDLGYALVFRPLDETPAGGSLELVEVDCSSPVATTMCTSAVSIATATYTNTLTGTTSCLDTSPGGASVVRPYSPPVATPMPPCFASDPQTVDLNLAGVTVSLEDAQIAGTYVGSPASSISNGMIRGFLTLAAADVVIPPSVMFVGGMRLAALLPGGMGSCMTTSERDTHPVHGDGWWLFINFPAAEVPFSEP